MANGVSTEWHDILVHRGIYQNLYPKIIPQDVFMHERLSKVEDYIDKNKKDCDLDSLDLLDYENDEYYQQHVQNRINTMIENSKQPFFGTVQEISREDYVREVTEASNKSLVILYLYQDYLESSVLINFQLRELAKKYPNIKFVKSIATRCIEKFPDQQCPCLIAYLKEVIIQNVCMVDKKMKNAGCSNIEQFLIKLNLIETNINPEDEEMAEYAKLTRGKLLRIDRYNDEKDDREYISNQIKK